MAWNIKGLKGNQLKLTNEVTGRKIAMFMILKERRL